MFRDGLDRLGHVSREHLVRAHAGERRPAGEHLIGHGAERVQIGAVINVGIASRLLRRHVGRGADRHADRSQAGGAGGLTQRFRDAEVGHQGVPAGQQHVVGLDVAVDEVAAVRVGQRVGHVPKDAQRVAHGQLALAREAGPQRFSFHEGHRVVQQVSRGARRQERHDVRVLQRRRQLRLAPEPVHADAGG